MPPPAAVPAHVGLRVEDVSIDHEELALGAEDEDVVGGGGQGEEENLELEAHAQEHSTCN